MEHLDHPCPHFNDAKMARFCWGALLYLYFVEVATYFGRNISTEFRRSIFDKPGEFEKRKVITIGLLG